MSTHTPRYLNLSERQWQDKIDAGLAILKQCSLCPNKCNVNRVEGQTGLCNTSFFPRLASAFPHTGEEPPISGQHGSGTIFFAGCTMQCLYCQNYPFSQLSLGNEVPFEFIKDKMLELQRQGCHNINLVTPGHVIPQILIALHKAYQEGLRLPVVYNTSGYESDTALALLDGIVDIYLTDIRYGTNASGHKYSGVKQYATTAHNAVIAMAKQVGNIQCDDQGIAYSGLIIRLLLLPGLLNELKTTIRFIAEQLEFIPHISLMNQYFPTWKASENPELNQQVASEELDQAFHFMQQYGLTEGWIQEHPK